MPDRSDTFAAMGWHAFFEEQRGPDDAGLIPLRISTVHRSRLTAAAHDGPVKLLLPVGTSTTDFAVGDWVFADPADHSFVRRLERKALLARKTHGTHIPQLIAANIDTLFIVTSCNDDFNPARLERYLALANDAGTVPVIVLTKADQTTELESLQHQARALQRDLSTVALNAKSPEAATALAPWCGVGQTVALVGSSGVGKSTLLNTLTNKTGEDAQETGGIREVDDKGRHTTTARSLHAIKGGGWVIDTPGMRTLHVSDVSDGLDVVFAEITDRAPDCRFRDCTHMKEPGCAVQAGLEAGDISQERLDRWRKLVEENDENTPVITGARGNKRTQKRGARR